MSFKWSNYREVMKEAGAYDNLDDDLEFWEQYIIPIFIKNKSNCQIETYLNQKKCSNKAVLVIQFTDINRSKSYSSLEDGYYGKILYLCNNCFNLYFNNKHQIEIHHHYSHMMSPKRIHNMRNKKDILQMILENTPLTKNELLSKIEEKKNELRGLISDEGALFIIKKELGL